MHRALAVMGLQWPSTLEQVKEAYRKLAVDFHPDRNLGDEGAEKKFKEVQAAHDLLRKFFEQ